MMGGTSLGAYYPGAEYGILLTLLESTRVDGGSPSAMRPFDSIRVAAPQRRVSISANKRV